MKRSRADSTSYTAIHREPLRSTSRTCSQSSPRMGRVHLEGVLFSHCVQTVNGGAREWSFMWCREGHSL